MGSPSLATTPHPVRGWKEAACHSGSHPAGLVVVLPLSGKGSLPEMAAGVAVSSARDSVGIRMSIAVEV